MARRVVLFDRYEGGERGRFEAWKTPDNSFSATNLLVYKTGELGVRPGVRNVTPAGVVNGAIQGFGLSGVVDNEGWFVQGTAVRTFDIDGSGNLKTSATALASTPANAIDYDINGSSVVYLASSEDKVYKLEPQTGATLPTVTALANSPGGRAIAVYGDRIILGDIFGSFTYRLRFNEPADETTWPAVNFIDVGDGQAIAALLPQRQHLTIMKSRSHHVLTGVPGVNAVLRQVAEINGPAEPQQAALAFPDQAFYTGLGLNYPSTFNGATVNPLAHLNLLTTADADGGAAPRLGHGIIRGRDNAVVVVDGTNDRFLTNLYGVWTRHNLGVDVDGFTVPVMPTDQISMFAKSGDGSNPPQFYITDLTLDRPGFASDTFAQPGDASTTSLTGSVTFNEWHAPAGEEVYVRAVIVDFRKWDTGSATTNHFDLQVQMLRPYNSTSPVNSNTVSFDEAAASASTSGTLDRRIFGFGEQGPGNGLQLVFTNVRGVAFQRIQVVLETQPVRI